MSTFPEKSENLNTVPDSKSNQATSRFEGEFNCAQSVLSVFAEELGLTPDQTLKIASPFGAGIAYTQETCGAVSGALMAIGLRYGQGEHGTQDDKQMAYDLAVSFMTEFRKKHGSIKCRELLQNLDMSNPEELEEIRRRDLFNLRCTNQVKDAVELLEKIFKKVRPGECL